MEGKGEGGEGREGGRGGEGKGDGGSARNKASRSTGHLVAISLTQGLLVHLCPDK